MAKAILGYYATGPDSRVATRLSSENRLLRQRVADLEQVVLQLQQENDALASMATRVETEEVLELA
ncbi:MAG TPA: hypothetical protein VFO98_09315 [Marmoricola sp.]|jgi:hypothetical protein|nr:hypothetical protein [Marmoricola sp.]